MSAAESQEVCFLQGSDYRGFMESQKGPLLQTRGEIIGPSGEKLGEHMGAYRYTIGQRHGLGIASSRPYYVMELLPEKNIVKVGRKEDLYSSYVEADAFHWIEEALNNNRKPMRACAQIRYRHQAAPGLLRCISENRVGFEFEAPQWALTPGQALVCYDGDRVIGGGWIVKNAQ
jgi:tRNA-specific 2-thiouridylase